MSGDGQANSMRREANSPEEIFALQNGRASARAGTGPRRLPSADQGNAQRTSVTDSIKGQYAVTLTRLRDVRDPGPMRYVVQDLVPEGFVSMIYGDGGVAKSMLAMSLGTAIAGRTAMWMGRVVRPAPVVYADFELDEGEQYRRATRLARGALMDGVPADLYYASAVGEPPERFLRGLRAACEANGVKVVVLDSLGMALAGDAQSSTDVIGFHKRCIDPFRAEGITVLIVDHQGKTVAGERYQNKRAFGSVFKENCARSVLQVEPRERAVGMLRVKVRQTKTNFGSEIAPFGIELRFSDEEVELERFALEAGELAEERTMNLRDKILLHLKDAPAFPRETAENTASEHQSVKNEITRLRREGLVEDTGKLQGQSKQVRLTASGERAASVIASQDYIGGGYASTPETNRRRRGVGGGVFASGHMRRATKRDGAPCTLPATGSSGLCWAHDPANAEKRRTMASRAARSKPSKELAGVKAQLQDLADKILAGRVARADAAVVGQLLNIKLRAVEIERKVRETEEFEERISALERTRSTPHTRGGGKWGA
jgi:hypothetical protein